jgi:NAD(P)-dependent dehydrogenase (short-subunit alcohol dehydrogenase family)
VTHRLADKVSVVTGAGGGLGQAAALAFAAEGATVVAAELNADLLAKTAELAEAAGTPIHTSTVDLTTEGGAKALMDGVIQQHGRIDCLIIAASFVDFVPISEMTLSQWLGASAHAVGKGGMIALSRQLALEGGPHGIRVNSVSPGVIETPGAREAFNHVPAFEEGARTKTIINPLAPLKMSPGDWSTSAPMRRAGSPELILVSTAEPAHGKSYRRRSQRMVSPLI